MAVKIRLARRGRKKRAMYDVVIADARAPRDGRFIEKIGTYDPNTDPATIRIDNDKAFDWLMKGAQPTDTVRAMLSYRGVMLRKHLQIGVIKGALTQEQADEKLEKWLKEKEGKITGKVERLAKAKSEAKKAKLEAEAKVKEARAKALAAKEAENAPEEPADEVVEEPVVAETPAEQPVAEENSTVKDEAAESAPGPEEKTEETGAAEEPVAAEAPAEQPAVEKTDKVKDEVVETAPEPEKPADEAAEEPAAAETPAKEPVTGEVDEIKAEAVPEEKTEEAPDETEEKQEKKEGD